MCCVLTLKKHQNNTRVKVWHKHLETEKNIKNTCKSHDESETGGTSE